MTKDIGKNYRRGMRQHDDKIEGDYLFQEQLELHGMVTGNAYVADSAELHMFGMIAGDLHVQPGGTAHIFGTVAGSVLNDGGTVSVVGTVGGDVVSFGEFETNVDVNAIVSGNVSP